MQKSMKFMVQRDRYLGHWCWSCDYQGGLDCAHLWGRLENPLFRQGPSETVTWLTRF